jgi:hypothetical protein
MFVHLSGRSMLLGKDHWQSVATSKSGSWFGLDRHGQLALRELSIEKGEVDVNIFLGTTTCCGFFSPRSAVLDMSGTVIVARSLVDESRISNTRFEHVITMGSSSVNFDDVWRALTAEAANFTPNTAYLRCRSIPRTTSSFSETLLWASKSRAYLRARKEDLSRLSQSALAACLVGTFTSEESVELDRSSAALALLLMLNARHSESAAILTYDTIQHTRLVMFSHTAGRCEPVSLGRCAQVVHESELGFVARWADVTWTPLVNGFIMAGLK